MADGVEPVDAIVALVIDRLRLDLAEGNNFARLVRDAALHPAACVEGLPPSCSVADCPKISTLEEQVAAIVREATRPSSEPRSCAKGGLAPWQLRRLFEWIEKGIDKPLPVDEAAIMIGLSTKHFARAFRQSTGKPFHRWVLQRRVERVSRLLVETNEPLARIACMSGFADQSHMTVVFRKLMGMTPGSFRRALIRLVPAES